MIAAAREISDLHDVWTRWRRIPGGSIEMEARSIGAAAEHGAPEDVPSTTLRARLTEEIGDKGQMGNCHFSRRYHPRNHKAAERMPRCGRDRILSYFMSRTRAGAGENADARADASRRGSAKRTPRTPAGHQ